MVTPEETFFLTRAEAAAMLRLSTRSLDLMIAGGRLPASKVGKRVLVRREDLLKLAEEIACASPQRVRA